MFIIKTSKFYTILVWRLPYKLNFYTRLKKTILIFLYILGNKTNDKKITFFSLWTFACTWSLIEIKHMGLIRNIGKKSNLSENFNSFQIFYLKEKKKQFSPKGLVYNLASLKRKQFFVIGHNVPEFFCVSL